MPRRLLSEHIISVWIESDIDPDDQPLTFKGLRQDADEIVAKAIETARTDPRVAHHNLDLIVSETA